MICAWWHCTASLGSIRNVWPTKSLAQTTDMWWETLSISPSTIIESVESSPWGREAERLWNDLITWGGSSLMGSIHWFELHGSQAECMFEWWMIFFMSSVRILKVIKLPMVSLTPTQHPQCSWLSEGKVCHPYDSKPVGRTWSKGGGWCHWLCQGQAVKEWFWCCQSRMS
jgi:hypothetical protein